jgi:hypothetical protein
MAGRGTDGASADAALASVQVEQHITVHNAPVTTVQNITNIQNNILAIGCLGPSSLPGSPLPGWPTKWPTPAATPRPFSPPGFAITLDILRRAMISGVKDANACLRGEPAAVATLLVEIVKLVHADPYERNIFPDPKRADRVLVYVPEHWKVLTLQEGIRLTLSHVVGELAEATPAAPIKLRNLAAGAKAGFQAQEDKVVKSSHGAMAAHLENLSIQAQRRGATGTGDSWLGALEGSLADGPERPREFGRERHGHIELVDFVVGLENFLGAYGPAPVTEGAAPAMARRALEDFAHRILKGHPENLTVLLTGSGQALVRTSRGWKSRPAVEVAEEQARNVAAVVVEYIRGQGTTPLKPVADYIEAHGNELATEEGRRLEMLSEYSRAAEKYYVRTESPAYAELRERIAEKEALGALAAPVDLAQPADGTAGSALPLTEAELSAILGWA